MLKKDLTFVRANVLPGVQVNTYSAALPKLKQNTKRTHTPKESPQVSRVTTHKHFLYEVYKININLTAYNMRALNAQFRMIFIYNLSYSPDNIGTVGG